MKKHLLVLPAHVAFLLVATAAPVAACHDTLRGDQVIVLNQETPDSPFGLCGCEQISWFGSVKIDGKTQGMALYPIRSKITDGVMKYKEGWKVFTKKSKVRNGELRDCTPGRVLLAGKDKGVAYLQQFWFESDGTVRRARGQFRDLKGSDVYQYGELGPVSVARLHNVFGFEGHIEIG